MSVRNIIDEAFKDKVDKAGRPYIGHLFRVYYTVLNGYNVSGNYSDDVLEACLLHDLIEDTDWTFEQLLPRVSKKTFNLVKILTRNKNEDYFTYINRVKKDPDAIIIKLADLKDNMNMTRLNNITEKDLQRLLKYHTAYKMLKNEK